MAAAAATAAEGDTAGPLEAWRRWLNRSAARPMLIVVQSEQTYDAQQEAHVFDMKYLALAEAEQRLANIGPEYAGALVPVVLARLERERIPSRCRAAARMLTRLVRKWNNVPVALAIDIAVAVARWLPWERSTRSSSSSTARAE